jgi:RNA 2',3'-cyclic 3'-phosphodiesterase
VARLFCAVDVDERTRSAVAAIGEAIAGLLRRGPGAGRVAWVRPEHLHLTVRFLGDVREERVEAVCRAMAEPLSEVAFDLTLEGLGVFPPAGRPRVVWLGVAGGKPALERLAREVDRRLEGIGIPSDGRPFQAHLTLGRFRSAGTRLAVDGALAEAVKAGPCLIDRVTLYESDLSSSGPRYTALAHALMRERP